MWGLRGWKNEFRKSLTNGSSSEALPSSLACVYTAFTRPVASSAFSIVASTSVRMQAAPADAVEVEVEVGRVEVRHDAVRMAEPVGRAPCASAFTSSFGSDRRASIPRARSVSTSGIEP